jgi:heterodisulfide reductase subunit C
MDEAYSLERFNCSEVEKIEDISGTNVFSCYQCGNCSSGCPAADYMEIKPHQVMRFIQMGQVKRVVESNTPWICAACITCTAGCPKGVDIAAVMEAARQLLLRKNIQRIDISKIEKEKLSKLPQIVLVNSFRKLTL